MFEVLTIFPEFFRGPFEHGVVARARESGILDMRVHDLRNWTFDRHRTVDDRPFGGGEGMLLKPEPLFLAVESIWPERTARRKVVLLSAQGRLFDQATARRFASLDGLLLICGRYEGVDERVAEHLADEEISIGDYVLSGGELPAAVVIDAVARLLPGVLGNEASALNESFSTVDNGEASLLDWPQYTRPADFRGWQAPEVLLSGHHEQIRRWRRQAAIAKMQRLRPDLAERRRTPAVVDRNEPAPDADAPAGPNEIEPGPGSPAGENRKEPEPVPQGPGGRNSH
jgi:tRNA (guanine37-N1)-methyltransferase